MNKSNLPEMRFLITGGAGFIESAVIRFLIKQTNHHVINVDKLTYAGNLESLAEVSDSDRYHFKQEDICDSTAIEQLFNEFRPDVVMHLAAESHVDRSISGKGGQVRDWLHVEDHAHALYQVAIEGEEGQTYNIGGHNEKTNLEVVKAICTILDEIMPKHPVGINSYEELITYVKDRPGHDQRYAIDASKIQKELGWVPKESFETGIRKTVLWYLESSGWIENISSGEYRNWMAANYDNRNAL